ncbi:MAG TPA: FAD-binding protein, partial [Ramlibacter sp.]|nr:FAD-binding protein [Ramlibacter sp.]
LEVTRSSDQTKPHAIRSLPLMAIPICPGITYTMGGIDIDANAQVLDTGGNPIPGLFAAGATTGGIEGGQNAVYIGGLIKAGSFGLLAAERVAALEGKTVDLERRQVKPDSGGAGAPDEASDSRSKPQAVGLARFPILRALVRHGKPGGAVLAVVIGLLVTALGWGVMGWWAIPLAVAVAAGVLVVVLGCVEMVTMVTELLMPQ